MSCTLTHYDLAKRRVYSAWEQCCLPQCSSVGSTAGQTLHFFCILESCEQRLPSPGWVWSTWLWSLAGWPCCPLPCTSTTTAHTAQDRDSQGHRISLPTLVVQHLLPMASKEDLSAGWQLWAQDKALWLSVQPVPGTGGLVCCSQDEIYWTETRRTLQNAVTKGLAGSWRHRPYGFMGRDGCPRGHLAKGTCFVLQTELWWKTLLSAGGSSLPGSELPAHSWANRKECTPQQCFFINYFYWEIWVSLQWMCVQILEEQCVLEKTKWKTTRLPISPG